MNRFITAVVFLLATVIIYAQPACNVRTFSVLDGLSTNLISGISQDKNGQMWFSTWNGLCSYDGYRFTTFRDKLGRNEGLTTNRILMLAVDSDNNIWCTTYDKRPYLFDTKKNYFVDIYKQIEQEFKINVRVRKIYALANGATWIAGTNNNNIRIQDGKMEYYGPKGKKLGGDVIRKVTLDDSGREWVFTNKSTEIFNGKFSVGEVYEHICQDGDKVYFGMTDGKMGVYDSRSNKFRRLSLPAGISRINCLLKISKGRMMIGTDKGVAMLDEKNNQVQMIHTPGTGKGVEVVEMYADSKERIWTFCKANGVTVINGKDLSSFWLDVKIDDPLNKTVSEKPFFIEDKNNTIWLIPTKGTFCYYCESENSLKQYVLNSADNEFSRLVTFDKFYIDNQKNLWFTGTHDLTLINFKYSQFKKILIQKSVESRAVCSLANGKTLVGTSSGRLVLLGKDRNIEGYINAAGGITNTPYAFEGRIYAIMQDSKKRIWIGSKDGGVYLMMPDGRMSHYKHSADDEYSLSGDEVYAFDQDDQGRIWVGSYDGGLNLVDDSDENNLRFFNGNNKLPKPDDEQFRRIRRITHTRDGVTLVSTTDGLVTFDNRFKSFPYIKYYCNSHILGDTTSLLASDVMQVQVMRSGRVFVTTMSGGLQEIETKTLLTDKMKLHAIDLLDTQTGIIKSLAEDKNGNLWVIRENSVDLYSPSTRQIYQFGPNELGERSEFSEALPTIDGSGNITVGIMGGVMSFQPDNLKKSDFKPNIIFSSVAYQGETNIHPILNAGKLEIAADKRSFTIHFAALDYSNNRLIRYAYKVAGVDKEWNYTSTEHSASYNNFPPGQYKLLVKSTNADGVWMDNTEQLIIQAQPTFWESIWAKFLYAIVIVCIVYGVMRYYYMRKRAQMEHEMADLRTKFFTEISHKLRTPLTLIGGPVTEVLNSENLGDTARQHLEMVQRNSRKMLELVNKMLEHNSARNYFVDDDNAPVFGTATEMEETTGGNGENKDMRILVVEDNDDLRTFLVGILSSQYTVLRADNGKKGLEIAEKEMPDFILTDVMMPVMDGLTMIHQIKQNKDVCHIPIIVLSAKASLDDRLQGLKEGIDDYITKPFSATYLLHRVENIIAQRKMLQQTYLQHDLLSLSENNTPETSDTEYKLESPLPIVDADKEMMKTLMAYLEENITNSDIKIEDLAAAVNLGRTVFYGKIKSIVGMAPVDFVRHIRMQRAESLIANTNEPFSQIAYSVGFSDPKYFSKCFKKTTGLTPSEYRDKARG